MFGKRNITIKDGPKKGGSEDKVQRRVEQEEVRLEISWSRATKKRKLY